MQRRVVITGTGLISPLGNQLETLWQRLLGGESGIDFLRSEARDVLPSPFAGEAREFTGGIEDYGELEKPLVRVIKKGRKLMCREIAMGVASAQLALQDAGLQTENRDPNRIGVLFGSDYIMTEPEEFLRGIKQCDNDDGEFDFDLWGDQGLPKVEPLWLLKYLPNMPASHIAIYNDLRGPSNSITMREASSNLSVAEAFTTIRRDAADIMVAGATGTRVHKLRSIHVALQEPLAERSNNPAAASRPFDAQRTGMVIGEGAGAIVLESLEHAIERGANILGEVVGHASSCVSRRPGDEDPNQQTGGITTGFFGKALENTLKLLLKSSNQSVDQIGHINAHGLGTKLDDAAEAEAIQRVFSSRQQPIPVVAVKSATGNMGAGSGMVELLASLKALQHNQLFPTQNYEEPDPACPINVVTTDDVDPGDQFISCNVTPQGQASGLLVRRYVA